MSWIKDRQAANGPVENRIRSLDGIRGIAIYLVLLGHLFPHASSFSKPGVTVFFGLSGYLITRLLIHEYEKTGNLNLKAFYIRRIFRLAPCFLLVLSCTLVWCLVMGAYTSRLIPDALRALLYVANWSVAKGGFTDPLNHMWSLSVEEQFYFVWPITVFLLSGRRNRLAILAALAGLGSLLIASVLAAHGSPQITYRSDTAAIMLLLGCLGALLEAERKLEWVKDLGAWPILFTIPMIPFAYIILRMPHPWVEALLMPLVAGGAVMAAIGGRNSKVLSNPALVLGGQLSYSLYLWQTPITCNGIFTYQPHGLSILPMLAILALTFLLSWLTWEFVENPCRNFGRRLSEC